MHHAEIRLYERFGIVLGEPERKEIRERIESGRCLMMTARDPHGYAHYLIEMQGSSRMEVITVVYDHQFRHLITVLVPGPSEYRAYRLMFPEPSAAPPDPTEPPTDGAQLRIWRESLRVRLSQVARAAGITRSELHGYEDGNPCPRATFNRIAAIIRHDRNDKIARDAIARRLRSGQESREAAAG